ncbi:MAG: hypothetical protein OXN18_00020 [Gemmatimonadota bacterium]|nr:hypothetical protein [Gemmatimonadota bacterium]
MSTTKHDRASGARSLTRRVAGPARSLEASWWEVMRRVETKRRRTHALAASFVVGLLAAASAFLPVSPLYGWPGRAWEQIVALFTAETVEVVPTAEAESGPFPRPDADESAAVLPTPAAEAAVFLEATRAPIRIALHDALPGTEIQVVFVDGTEAGVFGSAASRFSREPGGIDVSVVGDRIRVEIPRSAERVLLLLEEDVLVAKDGASLDVRGPVASRSPDEIRFLVPGG